MALWRQGQAEFDVKYSPFQHVYHSLNISFMAWHYGVLENVFCLQNFKFKLIFSRSTNLDIGKRFSVSTS